MIKLPAKLIFVPLSLLAPHVVYAQEPLDEWFNLGLAGRSLSSVAVSARNSEVIYAGDYGGVDQGVYKTTNGGQTWVAVNSGLTNTTIHALALDPVDDQIVFVGTTKGGVFKSIDGGENWRPINKGLLQDYVGVVTIDPANGQIIYVGTNGGGVYKSTDGGESWQPMNSGLTNPLIYAIAIDPTDSRTIYAGTYGGGVFRSTDGGESWNAPETGSDIRNQRIHSLAIDPLRSHFIYAGASDGVFKSVDRGLSWTPANSGLTSENIYVIQVDKRASQILYVGTTSGGVFQSMDSAQSWLPMNDGLTNTGIRTLTQDPQNSNIMYAGTFGGGLFKINLSDPGDENHFIVEPQSLNFGETQQGEFVSLSFAITNTGISILSITDINSSNSAFLVSDTVFTVAPFTSHTVSVSFQPQRSGPFDGQLTIFQNNSSDSTTQLELIGWTPIELNSTITPNTSASQVSFPIQNTREVLLHLEASSNTNWAIQGSESAVLTIFVDDNTVEQNQDVVLFNGAQLSVYKLLLGRVDSGTHTVEFLFDGDKSSPGADMIHLEKCSIIPTTLVGEEYDIFRFSPILYGRDLAGSNESNHTDAPLLLYHEVFKEADSSKLIEYTMIFSNEDGGTNSVNLMSRWGRTTDIEWIYRVKLDSLGNILEDYYQGSGHVTTPFQGQRINDHPILKTVTFNNLFSDEGISDFKFLLSAEQIKKAEHSREILMDENPWTYKIMTEEMIREDKYEDPANPATITVSDARNYLYLEFNTSEFNGARITFGVQLRNDENWYFTDHNFDFVQAVNREGWRRSTIELPPGAPIDDFVKLQIKTSGDGDIVFEELSKMFMLSEEFELLVHPFSWNQQITFNAPADNVVLDLVTGIDDHPITKIRDFELYQNYPNPFNPTTTIKYSLSSASHVRLIVYNLLGQEVAVLVDGMKSQGEYQVEFKATGLASGVYMLKADNSLPAKKMLLLK